MNIKVLKRQKESFMVHWVNDQAIMSSSEGPNKADHGDLVTDCVNKKSCVEKGPSTLQTTENRKKNKLIQPSWFQTPVR